MVNFKTDHSYLAIDLKNDLLVQVVDIFGVDSLELVRHYSVPARCELGHPRLDQLIY